MEVQKSIFGVKLEFENGEFEKFQSLCTNHLTLQENVMDFDKIQILKAIVVEKADRDRTHILQRLYSRYSRIRQKEEKRELMS